MHMHISLFLKSYTFDCISTYTYTCKYIYICIYIYIYIYIYICLLLKLLRSAGHRVLTNHVSFNHKQMSLSITNRSRTLYIMKKSPIYILIVETPPGGFFFLACFGVKRKRTRNPREHTTHPLSYFFSFPPSPAFLNRNVPKGDPPRGGVGFLQSSYILLCRAPCIDNWCIMFLSFTNRQVVYRNVSCFFHLRTDNWCIMFLSFTNRQRAPYAMEKRPRENEIDVVCMYVVCGYIVCMWRAEDIDD